MTVLKIFFMLAMLAFMAIPFVIEYFRFRHDEETLKVSRFRLVVFTVVYAVAATLVLLLLTRIFTWVGSLGLIRWILDNVGSSRSDYTVSVYTAILINIVLGFGFVFTQGIARVGMRRIDVTSPKKDGAFSFIQKLERKRIARFDCPEGYFVGRLLKYLGIALSVLFAALFLIFQLPAVFGADWIPYEAISSLFRLSYQYPVIGLLLIWEIAFLLLGVHAFSSRNPNWRNERAEEKFEAVQSSVQKIDEMCKTEFRHFYAGSMELKGHEPTASADHETVSEIIRQTVESDPRNGKTAKDIYVSAIDRLETTDRSILFNGGFFTEFSMYFFRYLSVRLARGDHLIFVCNHDAHSETVKQYLNEGLREISSLYYPHSADGRYNGELEDPIWKIVAVDGTRADKDTVDINSSSILVTTLDFLCSDEFEEFNTSFVMRLDSVIFTDTLNSINFYEKHLSLLKTKLSNIVRGAEKSSVGARPIRYLFFDETRTPSMDKSLKNIFTDDIETVDIMENCYCPTVSCYHYEIPEGEDGKPIAYKTYIPSKENLSVMLDMAIRCIAEGASSVSVFMDEALPYKDFMESIDSYLRKFKPAGVVLYKRDKDGSGDKYKTNDKKAATLFINEYYYNPDRYSVILAWDVCSNLPSALRKYISMTTDKPSLVVLFSSPYLFRDYYIENMDRLWEGDQILRIPKTEKTAKDIAGRILVQANAGGISEKELFALADQMEGFEGYVQRKNVNKLLEAILRLFDIECEGTEIYRYFEYTSFQNFAQNGRYAPETMITLRSKRLLYDIIHMQDHITLRTETDSFDLPLPKKRLAQNYIVGQNLIFGGEIYLIQSIDVGKGLITAVHASGDNDDVFRYVQSRTYRLDCSSDNISYLCSPKKAVLSQRKQKTAGKIELKSVEITAFKAPAEVLTDGYYEVDTRTMDRTSCAGYYYPLDEKEALRTYRRYGAFRNPRYSERKPSAEGISGLSVRLCGSFGANRAKAASLAAVMLDEILRAKFPCVSDSLAVCAVNGERDESIEYLPKLQFVAKDYGADEDIELLILEDCEDDLGVIFGLMALGNKLLKTLFEPIKEYLDWYMAKEDRAGDYLWFGGEKEPECFDFSSLHEITSVILDNRVSVQYVDVAEIAKTHVCDFCGKRYANSNDIERTFDDRIICRSCKKELVGNNKATLENHLARAKMFMEMTYGVKLDETYEFCFDSTVKIINAIKRNENIRVRNTNITAKSYIQGKTVNAEYDLPGANLAELLVRELTHVWQLQNLPETVSEDVAKGHIALVGIQYLRHLNHKTLADVRAHYYESSASGAAEGYRSVTFRLMKNPQYGNNPFRCLMDGMEGDEDREQETPDPIPDPRRTLPDPKRKHGDPYRTENKDRFPQDLPYFYREHLPEAMKASYDQALEALRSHKSSFKGDGFEDPETIRTVLKSVAYDHPELFWYAGSYTYYSDGTVEPNYGVSEAEAAALEAKMEPVINEYLEGITDDMSAYDTALSLYIKLINRVDYDTIALNEQKAKPKEDGVYELDELRTICGVFLNGKSVCEGYARAYQYLLQKCGVECAECAGYIKKEGSATEGGGAHAWNLIKLDGEYYHLDATWDDSSNTVQEVKNRDIGFNYFCVTGEEIMRTRDLSLSPVAIPTFAATKCNYYHHNRLVLTSADIKRIKAILTDAMKKGESFCTFKCATQELFNEVYDKLFTSADQDETIFDAGRKVRKNAKFSYQRNDYIYTITINIQ